MALPVTPPLNWEEKSVDVVCLMGSASPDLNPPRRHPPPPPLEEEGARLQEWAASLQAREERLTRWALELRAYEGLLAEKEASLWREEERLSAAALETAAKWARARVEPSVEVVPQFVVKRDASDVRTNQQKVTPGYWDVSWEDRMRAARDLVTADSDL